jgi:hypothetical protein
MGYGLGCTTGRSRTRMRSSLQGGTSNEVLLYQLYVYAHRSPVQQEKYGAEGLSEEKREGKRQWK